MSSKSRLRNSLGRTVIVILYNFADLLYITQTVAAAHLQGRVQLHRNRAGSSGRRWLVGPQPAFGGCSLRSRRATRLRAVQNTDESRTIIRQTLEFLESAL